MRHGIILVLLTLFALLCDATAWAAEGRTAGQFSVTPRGSAQYSIPIWTPPGIHGVQPKLALTYDSQSSYGIMGPGWNLSGLSTISRCNRTYAQDGTPAAVTLTYADAFCLDGNRLRLTSSETLSTYGQGGTTYQTEIANFSNVIASSALAGNGPSYFTVHGKDGLTYEYGKTTDSKIILTGGTTPYVWALDKVNDRAGNTMVITYTTTNGAFVVASIQYTAPSGSTTYPYKVAFVYTPKSSNDLISKIVAGTQVVQTQQLGTISVTSSGTIVRQYNLAYTTSTDTLRATLTSIQECGGSAGTDCLATTSVGYQSGTAGVANPTSTSGSTTNTSIAYSADIDGDGKQDLIYAVANTTNLHYWVQFSTGSGYGTPVDTGIVTSQSTPFLIDNFDGTSVNQILTPVGGVWYAYKWNPTSKGFAATSTGIAVLSGVSYASADIDGDGRPDLAYAYAAADGSAVYVAAQFNTTSAGTVTFGSSTVVGTMANQLTAAVGALYGDNAGMPTPLKRMDFDGDGRSDLLVTVNYSRPSRYSRTIEVLSRGTGPAVFGLAFAAGYNIPQVLPVNWNDDACTDLVFGGTGQGVWISQCNGAHSEIVTLPATPLFALDWDGDGRTDLLANVGGVLQVYRSLGSGVSAAVSTGIPAPSSIYFYTATDINGDGLDDIVFAGGNGVINFGLHNGAGIKPDLAISFNDGYGNSFSPTFVSLAQNNYTQYNDATSGYQNYIGPLYVVNEAVFSDPSNLPNGTYNQQFNYAGAWTNLQGRGFQAFYSRRTLDSRNGLYAYQYYQRAFPYTRMPYEDSVWNGSFYPIQRIGTTAVNTLDATAFNQRYFPFISTTTVSQMEVGGSKNGQLITSMSTSSTYDNFGNLTNLATTLTDEDSGSSHHNYNQSWTSITTNTFSPQTSTWCLGLPTETTVTNSTSTEAAITRTVAYNNPDYTNCRETEKVIEPGSTLYKVTEDYLYDSFGNLSQDTVTGVGMPARVTLINWGATGQFLTTVTNPVSYVITAGYDLNTGNKTSQTDPNSTTANPIITSWQYDNFNRKSLETRPDGTSTSWSYNDCATGGCVNSNNKMTVTQRILNVGGSIQRVTNSYLDTTDRTLVTSSAMLNGAYDRNEVQYDSLGRIHEVGAPCTFVNCATYWTTNTYDVMNRLTLSQRPISATNSTLQSTKYDYEGRYKYVTDPLGHTKNYQYWVTGNPYGSQDGSPPSYFELFEYDPFGSLTKVSDTANNTLFTANYAYGLKAFMTSTTDMDLGPRSYTVDALGEVTAYSDNKSQNFSMTYDGISRPTTRTEPDLTTTWNWGGNAARFDIGRLNWVTSVGSAGSYTETDYYDSKTRLATRTLALPGDATYTYNYNYSSITGLLDTLQYPLSTSSYQLKLQYAYANGILQSVSDFNAPTTVFWTANTTNPRGQVTQEKLGNGVVTNRTFDAVTSWVNSIEAGIGGGAALQNSAYTFDLIGDVTQRQDYNLGLTENFYYDADYRLDHSTLNNTLNLQMAYDTLGMGNIASRSDVAGGAAWTYDPVRKHAVTQAGSSAYTYTYDGNGNAETRNGGAIAWTSYNYPSSITAGSESTTFQYDPNRQRWKTIYTGSIGTETTYHVGGLLEKVANGGTLDYRHYINAGGELVAIYSRMSTGTNTLRYSLADHLGSFASILTSTGTTVVNESFTAYGDRRSAETWSGAPTSGDETAINGVSRWGYTGQTVLGVSMGLNHMNGRVEDAITGRFLSPDPQGTDPSDTQSYNRYSYVRNRPLTLTDPSGFAPCGLNMPVNTQWGCTGTPMDWALAAPPGNNYSSYDMGALTDWYNATDSAILDALSGSGQAQGGPDPSAPGGTDPSTQGGTAPSAQGGTAPSAQSQPAPGCDATCQSLQVTVTSQSTAAGPPSLFQAGLSYFFAPSGTQFQSLWQAGRNFAAKGGALSQVGQFIGGPKGTYNFQLDSAAQGYGYAFYQDAANFGVGVFMNGYFDGSSTGYAEMLLFGEAYGAGLVTGTPSSNWSPAQTVQWAQWWTAGWNAAQNGNYPVQVGPPLQWPAPPN